MNKMQTMVADFLAQKHIAVTGVSRSREDAANLNYRRFKQAGYTVYAVNPNTQEFDGDPCYPDLSSLPEKPEAVFITNRPVVAEKIVQECVALGIRRVWIHCSLGTKPPSFLRKTAEAIGGASDETLRLCRENGISVIPGGCALMYLNADGAHKMMRGFLNVFGALKV